MDSVLSHILDAVNSTISMSADKDMETHFFNTYGDVPNWFIYSDYCLNDKRKRNDVVTFVVVPHLYDKKVFENMVNVVAPSDIKKSRFVKTEFLELVRSAPILILSFILSRNRVVSRSREMTNEKLNLMTEMDSTIQMLADWVSAAKSNRSYHENIRRKMIAIRRDMTKKSFATNLLKDILIVSMLAGYVGFLLNKKCMPSKIGWFSDRDKIIDAYDRICLDMFTLNYQGICDFYGIENTQAEIAVGIPNSSGKMWYDEFNRIPDHVTGALADWDLEKNSLTHTKFIPLYEKLLNDNPMFYLFRLNIAEDSAKCSRIILSNRTM